MKHFIILLFLIPFSLMAQEDIKHFNEGVKAHNSGDYPTAIACYKKCLEINPKNNDAKNNIGIALHNQGIGAYNKKEYTQAIDYCTKALDYDSKKTDELHLLIGNSHKELKQYKEALAAYNKGIESSKKPAPFHSACSWVYNDLNDNKNRMESMKKAVEHEPSNAEYQFWSGKTKQEVGTEEFKTADLNYKKAIELKPDYVEAYTELAAFYMTFEEFGKALPILKKAKGMGAEVDHLIEAAEFEFEMQQEDND